MVLTSKMKNLWAALALAAFALVSGAQAARAYEHKDLTVESFLEVLAKDPNAVVVDVRPARAYDYLHLEGSVNIPLKEMNARMGELKGKNPVFICQVGRSSVQASRFVAQQKKNVRNFQTGMNGIMTFIAEQEEESPEIVEKLRGMIYTKTATPGLPVPAATVETIGGEKIRLSSILQGKDSIVILMDPSSSEDQVALEMLHGLAKKYAGLKTVPIVPLEKKGGIEQLQTLAEKIGYDGEIYVDTSGRASLAFAMAETPGLALVDSKGIVRASGITDPAEKSRRYWGHSLLEMAELAAQNRQVPYPESALYGNLRTPEDMIGQPAPDFALKDRYGSTHTLSEYRGKNVVLLFWAYFCPYSRRQVITLSEYYRLNPEGIEVLSVTSQPAQQQQLQFDNFLRTGEITYPVLMSDGETPSSLFFVTSIPAWFIIDKEGIVREAKVGYSPDTAQIIRDFLKESR